jgi:hypothetical protein
MSNASSPTLDDIGADLGLLITTSGFSRAAQRRAARARGVQLDVITFADLAAWRPTFEMCQVCEVDPESDAMPGMMFVDRLAPGGEVSTERIYVGQCDRCQAVHIRCSCGAVNGTSEFEEGEPFECDGGCGRVYLVEPLRLDRDAIPENDNVHERVHLEHGTAF